MTVRFGKAVSLATGGGIVLLHYANEKGYIDINWDKVNRKLDKVTDKIEEKVTGEGPSWSDKVRVFSTSLLFFENYYFCRLNVL